MHTRFTSRTTAAKASHQTSFASGAQWALGHLNLCFATVILSGAWADPMTRQLEDDNELEAIGTEEEGGSGHEGGDSIKGVTTGAANWAPGKVSRERITPVHGTNE